MNILFIHGNYPGQFRSIVERIVRSGEHKVKYLTARKDHEKHIIKGVDVIKYEDVILNNRAYHTSVQKITLELATRGEIILDNVVELVKGGFIPDLIIFHGGNGIGYFLKELLPNAKIIGYFEWYFSMRCAKYILGRNDVGSMKFIKSRNLATESELLSCDAAVVPTQWQAKQFPIKLQKLLTIIFDGVDTSFFKPSIDNKYKDKVSIIGEEMGAEIFPNDILLTYATRGMEPMRGFPEFMETLPDLFKQIPNLKVIIGGRDRSAYGPKCPTHGGSWKEMILDKIPSLRDNDNIFYPGLMNYTMYRKMLQRSNLHCYLTHPYVTSWSLFEAVSCGTPIITNRSEATTGTLKQIKAENTIESVNSIKTKDGISKMIRLLKHNASPRIANLEEQYKLEYAMKEWEILINKIISK